MTEIYLQGTDVYDLVLRIRFFRVGPAVSLPRMVKYNIIPSEVRVPGFFSRKLLIVPSLGDASAYLHRKNILHRQYRVDYEFCEKLLLHWAAKSPETHEEAEILGLSGEYPSGRVDVLEFLDISPLDIR